MNPNALKIDPEFQGKIPPLTFEELNQLEANILRDGRIINPIIVWQGLIVDGHNRYHAKQLADGAAMLCEVSGAANTMIRRWESVFRDYPDILTDTENRNAVKWNIQKVKDYLQKLEDKL